MKVEIVTLGVYGFTRDAFFQAIQDAQIDTFCDLRRRRGMRGSEYAFANSQRLQQRLEELGIRNLHLKELAPSQNIRAMQKQEDQNQGVPKMGERRISGIPKAVFIRRTCSHMASLTSWILRVSIRAFLLLLLN